MCFIYVTVWHITTQKDFLKVTHVPRATTRKSQYLNGDIMTKSYKKCGYQGPKYALRIGETLKSIVPIAKGSPATRK